MQPLKTEVIRRQPIDIFKWHVPGQVEIKDEGWVYSLVDAEDGELLALSFGAKALSDYAFNRGAHRVRLGFDLVPTEVEP